MTAKPGPTTSSQRPALALGSHYPWLEGKQPGRGVEGPVARHPAQAGPEAQRRQRGQDVGGLGPTASMCASRWATASGRSRR